ncbi:MAG: ABC transporter substrate-binding protein, partial [Polaromonas sp.]|nr:ABC transporter substrate-binding protein [Polaromonas sp.]
MNKASTKALGRTVCALALALLQTTALAADIVISQLAPLTGVLASTGKQMVLGGQIYFS